MQKYSCRERSESWNPVTWDFFGPTYAINLIRSDNIVVKNSALSETGIWCDSSSKNALICNNTLAFGTIFASGLSTSILGNSIFQSKDVAITVQGTDEATVAQNVLVNCDTGISLAYCSLTSVMYNTIKECRCGIHLYKANDNTLTQNNFIDNVQHIGEDHFGWPFTGSFTSVNTWDRNYWSTYRGVDADGDGIGDTPYVVFEKITDYYPFMTIIDVPDVLVPVPDDPVKPFFKYSVAAVVVLIVGVGIIVSLFYFKKKQNNQKTPNP